MSAIPAILADFIPDARALREEWRYTNVVSLIDHAATPVTHSHDYTAKDGETLVITDNQYTDALNLVRQHITVGAGATVQHLRIAMPGANASQFMQTDVSVAAGGTYSFYTLTTGAERLRQQLDIKLEGEGANASIGAAYVLSGARHHDLCVRVHHLAPNTRSDQLVKGVVRDTARAAFQGKISVAAQAQNTEAFQLHKALLLGERAEVDAKPELEIFADQVKCSHGNAIGQLDEAALFYLRARGIGDTEARALLTRAFVMETLTRAPESHRAEMEQKLERLL